MTPRKPPKAPPFCPNKDCRFHTGDTTSWRYVKNGTFQNRRGRSSTRRSRPSTQRYICRECNRSFSDRTFRSTYWLKRPHLFLRVARGLVSCSGYRQLAAGLNVSPQTVARHAARLGKQALLFHEEMRQEKVPDESLALDSFVSFAYSQYFPVHFHFVLGRDSHFAYGFTVSEVRRSGTMTPAQRARRQYLENTLGRPDPKAREKDVAEILRVIANGANRLDLTTDEDQTYPRALRCSGLTVKHSTISSKEHRTPANPLFASNLHDLQVRHASANHKRETIAFSKTIQGATERMWLHLAWKNYVKSFSEKTQGETPAQQAGVSDHKWSFREIFGRRRFPDRIRLPEPGKTLFEATIRTRMYGAVERIARVFAY